MADLARGAGAGERHASPDPPPISGIPDRSGHSGVVPISLEGGEVIVDVTIDGKGPFPMMFDTGNLGAVTPETASVLGLKVEGSDTVRGSGEAGVRVTFARVKEMRLGGAELPDQPLLVLPLPRFVTDRGNRPPLAGVIGYELLARFAVTVDYDHKMLGQSAALKGPAAALGLGMREGILAAFHEANAAGGFMAASSI